MKKTISIILLAIASALCITSCNEEEVTPTSEVVNAGKELDPF